MVPIVLHFCSQPDSHLCILPTIHELCVKGDTIQQYMVNVSNNIDYILVYADVEFPGECSHYSYIIMLGTHAVIMTVIQHYGLLLW